MNAKTITLPEHAPKKPVCKGDKKEVIINNSRLVKQFDGREWMITQVLPV